MNTTQGLSREDRQSLRKVLRIIELFRSMDGEMPIQQAVVFLGVALNEGTSLKEMSDRLGLASSTASRNVAALSKFHRLGKPGLDMVDNREDPAERRRKVLSLTPKGKAARTKLIETIKGD